MARAGSVEIELHSAKNLMAMDTNGLSDPYVEIWGGDEKFKSKVIKKTLTPQWNEKTSLNIAPGMAVVQLSVFDWDQFGADDFMGEVLIEIDSLVLDESVKLTLDLKPRPGQEEEPVTGSIDLTVTLFRKPDVPSVEMKELDDKANMVRKRRRGGLFQIAAISGVGLAVMDSGGTSDPYVQFKAGMFTAKTKAQKKTTNPVWVEGFQLETSISETVLKISVYDFDVLGDNDFMGMALLSLIDLKPETDYDNWLQLMKDDLSGEMPGKIRLQYRIIELPGEIPLPSPREHEASRVEKTARGIGSIKVGVVAAKNISLGCSELPNAKVVVSLSKSHASTKVIQQAVSAFWNEAFILDTTLADAELMVSLLDVKGEEEELIGKGAITLENLTDEVGARFDEWVPLTARDSWTSKESIQVRIIINCKTKYGNGQFQYKRQKPSVPMEPDESKEQKGLIDLQVLTVRGLMSVLGIARTINAKVFMNIMGTQSLLTEVQADTQMPQWAEGVWIVVDPNSENSTIEIALRDDRLGLASVIAHATLDLEEIDFEYNVDNMGYSNFWVNMMVQDSANLVQLLLRAKVEQLPRAAVEEIIEGMGEIEIKLLKCSNLPVNPFTPFGSPVCKFECGPQLKISSVAPSGTSRNPVWDDENIFIPVEPMESLLHISVWFPNLFGEGKEGCIGEATIFLPESESAKDKSLRLKIPKSAFAVLESPSSLFEEAFEYCLPPPEDAFIYIDYEYSNRADEDEEARPPDDAPPDIEKSKFGILLTEIVEAHMGSNEILQPDDRISCTINLGTSTFFTAERELDHLVWKESFEIGIPHPYALLFITVLTTSGRQIGQAHISLLDVVTKANETAVPKTIQLRTPIHSDSKIQYLNADTKDVSTITVIISIDKSESYNELLDDSRPSYSCPWNCGNEIASADAKFHLSVCPASPYGEFIVACIYRDLGCTFLQQQRFLSQHLKDCPWGYAASKIHSLMEKRVGLIAALTQQQAISNETMQEYLKIKDRLEKAVLEVEKIHNEKKASKVVASPAFGGRRSSTASPNGLGGRRSSTASPNGLGGNNTPGKRQPSTVSIESEAGDAGDFQYSLNHLGNAPIGLGEVSSLSFAVDHALLLSGSTKGVIDIWSTREIGLPIKTKLWNGHTDAVGALCCWQDTCVSGGKDRNIVLWDIARGEILTTIKGLGGGVHSLMFSNSMVFAAATDKTIRIWDSRTWRGIATIPLQSRGNYGMALNGTNLLSASGKALKSWDLRELSVSFDQSAVQHPFTAVNEEASQGNVTGTSGHYLSPISGSLYTNSTDTVIRRWDATRLKCVALHESHTDYVRDIKGAGNLIFSCSDDKSVVLWRVNGMVHEMHQRLVQHEGFVTCLAVGRGRLYSGSNDGTIGVWQIERDVKKSVFSPKAARSNSIME